MHILLITETITELCGHLPVKVGHRKRDGRNLGVDDRVCWNWYQGNDDLGGESLLWGRLHVLPRIRWLVLCGGDGVTKNAAPGKA